MGSRRVFLVGFGLLCASAGANAWSWPGRTSVDIVDRASGRVLPTYSHNGETWVEGTPHAKYGIRVRNNRGERVLTVISVDGVNVLTGQTAGVDQRGYVFNPRAQYDINGWRKTDFEVAAFAFSQAANSYANQTGRPDHIGMIGVAVFNEKRARVLRDAEPLASQERALPPPALAAPAPSQESDSTARARAAPKARLGTAHGERETSHVETVGFERASDSPIQVIRIRYDSRENLVSRGIIAPVAWLPDSRLNPFPASSYVPDPPHLR
jgi:hypothetical protein